MPYNIPVRLAKLGRHQAEIIDIFHKDGENVTPCELSLYIHEKVDSPKAKRVLTKTDRIISGWEWEAGENAES